MAHDDGFDLWLGRIGQDRPLRQRLSAARARSGRRGNGKPGQFSGARIGRGSGVGRILASRASNAQARRVVVKARIVRLAGNGLGAARAHLRYLERDGTTREGTRGTLYGPGEDQAGGKAFLERGEGDRHQFRFIVSPEDGAEYDDLKPLVRRLMERAEQDLGTRLDWVAVDHFNTGHPHSHVIVRGKDDLGKDLVIAREYLTQGFRERAAELVSIDLGPRTREEILRSQLNEVGQERFTDLDRRLVKSIGEDGLVRPAHHDGVEQSLRAGRLQTLARMGLASEASPGAWNLDPQIEPTLRRMGETHDIIRTMQRAMREKLPQRLPGDMAIHDPAGGLSLVGRLVERGLSDEHADRHYLIVDSTDGLTRYVDIGVRAETLPENSIVRITGRSVAAHAFDHTVAEVAAVNGGHYSVDAHLRHDARANEAFADRHVRRLEAMRHLDGSVIREGDGSWTIAADHIERAEAYERMLARQAPVVIETLSAQPIEQLPTHDGATWLDSELVSGQAPPPDRGFGTEVRAARALRRQWLIEQGLAETDGETTTFRPGMLATLQSRELRRVATQLSKELGLTFTEAQPYDHIEGKVTRSVQLGDRKFALVERSRDFTLVPWRPVLERAIGKQVSGIVREGGIDWTIGRSRGLNIGM